MDQSGSNVPTPSCPKVHTYKVVLFSEIRSRAASNRLKVAVALRFQLRAQSLEQSSRVQGGGGQGEVAVPRNHTRFINVGNAAS